MPDFLLFQLYGPMSAWGDIAVGEVRPVLSVPSRSAIFGLVASALGIRRHEEEALLALDAGYHFATKVEAHGSLLVDFHTMQPPRSVAVKKWRPSTRREETYALGQDATRNNKQKNTMLSSREYRTDALALVALWAAGNTVPEPLKQILEALRQPVFVPYLGRKSCPLSLPLMPQVIATASLKDAFASYREAVPRDNRIPLDREATIQSDVDDSSYKMREQVVRRDRLRSRERWQFDERAVWRTTESRKG